VQEERLAWLSYQKKKWAYQLEQRAAQRNAMDKRARTGADDAADEPLLRTAMRGPATQTIGGFLKRAQRSLLNTPWQILQVSRLAKLQQVSHTPHPLNRHFESLNFPSLV